MFASLCGGKSDEYLHALGAATAHSALTKFAYIGWFRIWSKSRKGNISIGGKNNA
jgi:hypothetical protein